MAAGGSATSTTRSGISAGVIEITDGAKQQAITGKTARQTIAGTNREVSSERDGSNALAKIFDEQEIRAGFEIVEALQREVGVFVTNRAQEADALEKARDQETDPARRAALDQELQEARKWAPGGDYRRVATAITAAAGGNVTGGMADLLTKATINYIQSLGAEKVKAIADEMKSESARAALQGIVGCAGAAASGGNCGAGALGGSASVVLNNLLDKAGGKSGGDLSQEEKQARTNLVTSIVAGIAGAAGSGGGAATASTSAKIETENNAVFVAPIVAAAGEAIAGGAAFCATRVNFCKAGLEAAKGAGIAFGAWLAARMTSSEPDQDHGITATPNPGPRGGTVTTTPGTGKKGPTITGTPDQGERGATITGTPNQGIKGPTITATPNDGPKVFDPMFARNTGSLTTAEQIGILQDAAAGGALGKGNFGLGQATAAEANQLGEAWVGPGYRVSSDGSSWVSSDGLRIYRPPSAKPNSPYATTGVQANFESKLTPGSRPISNGHLNITP
ncbi:hypothetical protein GCM10027419_15690 [Pandoraea terrae]